MYITLIEKSVQNGVVDFNNFLLNKAINVLSHMIYCLIFSVPHVTFKRH